MRYFFCVILVFLCTFTAHARTDGQMQVLPDTCAVFNAYSPTLRHTFAAWLSAYLHERYKDQYSSAAVIWVTEYCQRNPHEKIHKVLTYYIETLHGGAPRLISLGNTPLQGPIYAPHTPPHTEPWYMVHLWTIWRFVAWTFAIQVVAAVLVWWFILRPFTMLQRRKIRYG